MTSFEKWVPLLFSLMRMEDFLMVVDGERMEEGADGRCMLRVCRRKGGWAVLADGLVGRYVVQEGI